MKRKNTKKKKKAGTKYTALTIPMEDFEFSILIFIVSIPNDYNHLIVIEKMRFFEFIYFSHPLASFIHHAS